MRPGKPRAESRPASRRSRTGKKALVLVLAAALSFAVPATADPGEADPAPSLEERLWQHRNLGKAFYENSATQYQAVEEFQKALALAPDSARERVNYGLALLRAGKVDEGVAELEKAQKQDPAIPHTWFNLGIAYKQASRYDEARAQLQTMVELVPTDPIAHYNLGVLHKLAGAGEQAISHFERAAEIDSNLAGPHFQLATAYRQAGRADEAKTAMERFRELKKRGAGAAVAEDLEWSWYSEVFETLEPANAGRGPTAEARYALEHPRPAPGAPEATAERVDPASVRLAVLDLAHPAVDGVEASEARATASAAAKALGPTLVYASASGVGLLASRDGAWRQLDAGLGAAGPSSAVAVGDFDNDGLEDLALAAAPASSASAGGEPETTIWRNAGTAAEPRFEKVAGASAPGLHGALLWLDYDHDYDLDLLAFGDSPALLRNEGKAGFAERTADFPFVSTPARDAVIFDMVSDSQGADVAVATPEGGVLYRDRLGGRYESVRLRSLPATTQTLEAADFDHDGWTDLLAFGSQGVTFAWNSERQTLRPEKGPQLAMPAITTDVDGRGTLDLMAADGLRRHRGSGRFEARSEGTTAQMGLPADVAAWVGADFDRDGRQDLAGTDMEGRLFVALNRTDSGHRHLRVDLRGVKNLRRSPGAEVEIKAGAHYQKRLYTGQPLVFGLGDRETVDTVRISWPNGLIQNESQLPTHEAGSEGAALEVKEAQRLSGSCPMIFTWNGSEWQFITDVLGVAPLGASAGNGEYFPVDHDEWIQIPGDALTERDGAYEVRITEELREIAYLDEIRLAVVDHPADVDIFVNDKFKGPPFPEHRLFGASERFHPRRAIDHRGIDVAEKLRALDRVYPDAYERDYAGVAERHYLELDFGQARDVASDGDSILVLSGWVDWADGSTFSGVAQERPEGLILPSLQAKDADGRWVTIVEDMGIPAGKPKTIVVDLSGLWPSDSRQLRIETNLCVYWDEIFLAEDPSWPETREVLLAPATADLRFRGFSRPVVHPERKQPEVFVYADRTDFTSWNPTRGLYTRYGDVRPLLTEIDDRFVIMGSGDELVLRFETSTLAPVPTGWTRDFLLFVDGWAKDGDANTAHSQTVGPLPHHGMPRYPWGEETPFPDGPAHLEWQERYNTRPALRLIRPLAEGLPQAEAPSPDRVRDARAADR